MLSGLTQLPIGCERGTFLKSACGLEERFVGMEHHQPPVAWAGADTGGVQGTDVAHVGVEPKGVEWLIGCAIALARTNRDDGGTDLSGRTGAQKTELLQKEKAF